MDDPRHPRTRAHEAYPPVHAFPPLPPLDMMGQPGQFAAMARAIARLEQHPADNGAIIAFEAQTYIAARQHTCAHAWVTVNDHHRPVYRECIRCDRRRP